MKRIAISLAALAISAGAASADPLLGTWMTTPDDNGNRGVIKVSTCGSNLCGVLVSAIDSAGKKITSGGNIGRQLIWNTTNKGNGVYKGKVYSPDRDKTYNSKLILSGSNLSVSGCVLGVCREGGTWKRQ